jgi:hypothetical protein
MAMIQNVVIQLPRSAFPRARIVRNLVTHLDVRTMPYDGLEIRFSPPINLVITWLPFYPPRGALGSGWGLDGQYLPAARAA